MIINPVKGTHDIVSDEADVYFSIEYAFRVLANNYGYKEIVTPIIEHTPLFIRSVGESSDIVNKEMYTFDDKGGRSLTLRPEMTAGVMRSVTSNKLYANADLPLKYFYLGPCFRYERPQAGRYRQFHQLGVEAIGTNSYYQDIEVILLGKSLLDTIGIKNYKILINSLGDESSRAAYREALKEYFSKNIDKMCEDCKHRLEVNPLRILDCKVESDRKIILEAPKMKDYLSIEAKERFDNIIDALNDLDIKFEIDDTLVRGLDYYTGIVFEYHMNENDDVGAIGGGGHYNNLLKEIGGPDLEGVGLSFGLERLFHVYERFHPDYHDRLFGIEFYLMGLDDNAIFNNLSLSHVMRKSGFSVDLNYELKSFKTLFKIAEHKRAKFAIIVGENELESHQLNIKNLKTQEQTTVKFEDLFTVLDSLVNEYNEKLDSEDIEDEKNM